MVNRRLSIVALSALLVFLAQGPLAAQQVENSTLSDTETSAQSEENRSDQEDTEGAEDSVTDEEDQEDTDSGGATWRPRSGSIFGSGAPTQRRSTDLQLTGHPVRPEEENSQDDRPELLTFDLYFDDGVRFSQRYRNRLEDALQETLDEVAHYRILSSRERSRRLTEASFLVGDEVTDDYAEEVAVAIGVDYYLVPRIEVENSRTYRITVVIGRAGEGELGRTRYENTSNRVVDNVEREIERLTERALARETE